MMVNVSFVNLVRLTLTWKSNLIKIVSRLITFFRGSVLAMLLLFLVYRVSMVISPTCRLLLQSCSSVLLMPLLYLILSRLMCVNSIISVHLSFLLSLILIKRKISLKAYVKRLPMLLILFSLLLRSLLLRSPLLRSPLLRSPLLRSLLF